MTLGELLDQFGPRLNREAEMKLALVIMMLGFSTLVWADNGNRFGWENGRGNPHHHGAPGPLIGAGITSLLAAGGTYWAIRRRRAK